MRLTLATIVAVLALLAAGCKDDRAEAREALARGRQLEAWHRDHDADGALRDAARLDPKLYEARMRLARLALDAGRFADAKTLAASVLHDVPQAPYPLELLGRAELGLGHREPAVDALVKARDADPTRVRLGFEIGRIDEQLGRRDDALAAYRALVHADAHALDARVALAHLLLPGPPRDEAHTLLVEAKSLAPVGSPQSAQIDGMLAWIVRLDAPPAVPPALAREHALALARNVGILRLLEANSSAFSGQTVWGDAVGLGGALNGSGPPLDSFGGLGTTGVGVGGGGTGVGLGGNIGVLGHGDPLAPENRRGMGGFHTTPDPAPPATH